MVQDCKSNPASGMVDPGNSGDRKPPESGCKGNSVSLLLWVVLGASHGDYGMWSKPGQRRSSLRFILLPESLSV
jgi:hypothetical protein